MESTNKVLNKRGLEANLISLPVEGGEIIMTKDTKELYFCPNDGEKIKVAKATVLLDYLKKAQNLADVPDKSAARSNLDIFSKSEILNLLQYLDDLHFEFSQGTPALTWNITHNLNKYPSVTVTDSAGTEVECEVQHNDINSLILNFSEPFAGSAYLN